MTHPALPPLPEAPFTPDADEYSAAAPIEPAWYWRSIEPMLRTYGQSCYEAGFKAGEQFEKEVRDADESLR